VVTSPAQPVERDAVSPLELFFDLVFVFAVSQLSHHLLEHLSWRGAAETLVLLIAVFGIWSGTSFEATLLNIGRSPTQWMLLAVMLDPHGRCRAHSDAARALRAAAVLDPGHGAAVDRGRDQRR
jgi:hypothetical protein